MILKLFFINFFILHPLIFISIHLLPNIFFKIKNFYSIIQEERKITKEIPALIDFLKSYLLSGLLLPAATMAVLKQKKWCKPIQYSLIAICNNYAQGKSFKESLSDGIYATQGLSLRRARKAPKSSQYLCLLYLSLRLGCSTGENITHILEKVKNKTQDCLNLDRKLKITTAQMRLQSLIIILSPLFLSIIIYFIAPEYILFFFQSFIGRILLLVMLFLNVLGAYFLKKILKIR